MLAYVKHHYEFVNKGTVIYAFSVVGQVHVVLTGLVPCCACRTIVYKGMLRSAAVAEFYKDLTNPLYTSAFAVYHRRFSTNTTPKWPLAQPMRVLGHNGAPQATLL